MKGRTAKDRPGESRRGPFPARKGLPQGESIPLRRIGWHGFQVRPPDHLLIGGGSKVWPAAVDRNGPPHPQLAQSLPVTWRAIRWRSPFVFRFKNASIATQNPRQEAE
jgi:hypothetical protein